MRRDGGSGKYVFRPFVTDRGRETHELYDATSNKSLSVVFPSVGSLSTSPNADPELPCAIFGVHI